MDPKGNSMKTKILVRGPVLSQSGYGEQSRFALRALRSREDIFDIYIIPVGWGATGWCSEDTEERRWIDKKIVQTNRYIQQGGDKAVFDMSLQITIPNEWEKMAPINVGYTAGIETTKVSPVWLEKANMMDRIIVVSNHAKYTFDHTNYAGEHAQTKEKMTLTCQTPIEVVNYAVRPSAAQPVELELDYDFNYLCMAQFGPRKNLMNTIRWFIEENFDQEVGLIVKTNIKNNSIIDREHTDQKIRQAIGNHQDRKCKIYLLHGDLTHEEVTGLYRHPKVKAMISATHGEGFGLPLFEAAYNGLPVIAPGWSGQCDFLYMADPKRKNSGKMKPMFASVEYNIQPVQEEAHWPGVIQPDSMWCFPKEASFKRRLREMKTQYSRFKKNATKLQKWILKEFTEEKKYSEFCDGVMGADVGPVPVAQDIQDIKGISFCISTNSKKQNKTKIEINSIRKTMKTVKIPYEIILAGDVTSFEDDKELILIHTPDDAHNGLLAKLRNNAGENAKYDVIVFADDDLIFSKKWASRLIEFSQNNGWNILGHRVLLPDGGRYWDRATINPHQLIDYDNKFPEGTLYQSGCFWIIRKKVYDEEKWDSTIEFYAERNGKLNEDVEYSVRLQQKGYTISFDKENLVWHNDDNYIELKEYNLTVKKEIAKDRLGIKEFPKITKHFQNALNVVQ
jgi:glycosyltransferase involved in cell wall biosynthesis